MFSGLGVYAGDRILFVLRDHEKLRGTMESGSFFWRAPIPELRREFPSILPVELLRSEIGHWLLIPEWQSEP
jgi:hypothetical protein